MPDRRILITGASGFVGAHLAAGFHAAGWDVIAGMRQDSDPWRLQILTGRPGDITRAVVDLQQPDEFMTTLAELRPQVVINSAAYGVDQTQQDTLQSLMCNAQAPALLVEAAAGVGVERFIHLGTACEYGDHRGAIAETTTPAPRGLYAASKAAGSLLVRERAATLGLPIVVFRPFGLYGPLEGAHKLFPQLIHACRCGVPLDLTPGEQVRDYMYVDDLVRACLMIGDAPAMPVEPVFNLGSGAGLSVRQLGSRIAAVIGRGDQWLRWGKRQYRCGDPQELVADTRKIEAQLGWSAQIPIEEGILRMLAFQYPERVSA